MLQQSPEQFTRELHIDVNSIDDKQVEQLLALGFIDDDFTEAGGGLERPVHHFSWQTHGTNVETAARRREIYDRTVKLLSETPGFSGYIESEIITSEFHATFERRTFDPSARIPLERLDLVKSEKNKVADLHFKVPLALLDDPLEKEFGRIGCYFVETPRRNRIYTIQFLSHTDGKPTFNRLKEFFAEAGGVVELTYEVCDAFYRIPAGLSAPTVVREGSLK